jgi:hypothetical protein
MLVGRESERSAVDALLHSARGECSAALVLRGEPGIGKTALLEYAADSARDMTVLRCVGIEAEYELPFAGMHQLVRPCLELVDRLPGPQAAALRGARMREAYVHGAEPRDAIVTGFGHSARVVVAGALIMIGVFGGFVLDTDPIVKSIGLSLAFGVLVDAFIVRMTLVPAVMALLGRPAWWMPSHLGRLVPNVDIEGEKLLKGIDQAPARA